MKTIIVLSIAIFSFNQLHASNLVLGDNDEGQVLYKQVCSSCHDSDGINNTPAPMVAGQRQLYVQKQLDDYRLGKRPDISMGAMPEVAKSLTKEQIKAVAQYISTLESCDTPVTPDPGNGNIEMGKELGLDLLVDLRVVFEELLSILSTLADSLVTVTEPSTTLVDNASLGTVVNKLALAGDALTVKNVELGFTEWRSHFVLNDFNSGAVTNDSIGILDGADAADI